jgi:hypothetical protein
MIDFFSSRKIFFINWCSLLSSLCECTKTPRLRADTPDCARETGRLEERERERGREEGAPFAFSFVFV